jgi:hypothetical protein
MSGRKAHGGHAAKPAAKPASIIQDKVGERAANNPDDVRKVQELLGRHQAWLDTKPAPQITGQLDATTSTAIVEFQRNAAALAAPDGTVAPGSFTLRWLERPVIPPLRHRIFANVIWSHPAEGSISEKDLAAAATTLGCEVAALKAVKAVETGRSPWEPGPQKRPSIRFERHYFSRLTHRAFDRTHPDIANPHQGGYGREDAHFQEYQYERLRRAAMLDESAALQSASWGTFQLMGAFF